jgi:hypothetical protein
MTTLFLSTPCSASGIDGKHFKPVAGVFADDIGTETGLKSLMGYAMLLSVRCSAFQFHFFFTAQLLFNQLVPAFQ